MDAKNMKPESIAAQELGWVDDATKAIAPPIYTATTYLRDVDNQYRSGRVYARDQNPTFDQAEAVLTALEGGHQTLLFASGMAAATAVFQALAPGDHVLAPKVMYWSLRNWLKNFATHGFARRREGRDQARADQAYLDRNACESLVDPHRYRRHL
jgi:cystathionine gamma-synthase